ncbi:Putative cyclase [Pseudosulfitobacter pseudonitzschiae]|nr:Putative cyclase [Pseudosulfitobacter pseudonitzschiae]
MKIVDLSNPLENTQYADPPGLGPRIDYMGHDQTADQMLQFFPGVTRDQLPGGEGWAVEQVTLSTHNGTHLDAPYHYHSTMDGGRRAITIDEVPREWCYGRGVKLDFRHFADGHVVTGDEMSAAFHAIGHELTPGDIVLVNTAAGGGLRAGAVCGHRLWHGTRRDSLSDRARGAGLRDRCVELGRPLCPHRSTGGRDWRRRADLGRTPRGHGAGVLPYRKAGEPRGAASDWF